MKLAFPATEYNAYIILQQEVNQLLWTEYGIPAPDVKREYAVRVTQEANKSLHADKDLEVFTKPKISMIDVTEQAGKGQTRGKMEALLLLLLQAFLV